MKVTDITVTRMIEAPAEKIFDVWIDAKSPGGPWFGSQKVILNPVVDGLFYHAMMHEGKNWAHYGRFTQVNRPSVVEHTWMSEATKGLETMVTVTFKSQGDKTEVTLRHTGVPDDDLGRQHKDGWGWILGALADGMAAKAKK
jgi:uncharacterized protein YndB with AHSA1/START domain